MQSNLGGQRSMNHSRRKSMSRRSFRATRDQYDELPNDKEKLTKIMVAKNKHLKKMQKILDDAENDAIESEMISDPEELRKLLNTLQKRDYELNKDVERMPGRIGKSLFFCKWKNRNKKIIKRSFNFLKECYMIKSWKLRKNVEMI